MNVFNCETMIALKTASLLNDTCIRNYFWRRQLYIGNMGVGRIFSMGVPVGDFPKIFSRGGQKWWNLVYTPRNWKNNLFLLIISNSRGPSPPFPPSYVHDWQQFFRKQGKCMHILRFWK